MLDFKTLSRLWKEMTYYERFEQIASRIVMLLISALIVYLLVFVAVDLFGQFKQGLAFADVEARNEIPCLFFCLHVSFFPCSFPSRTCCMSVRNVRSSTSK